MWVLMCAVMAVCFFLFFCVFRGERFTCVLFGGCVCVFLLFCVGLLMCVFIGVCALYVVVKVCGFICVFYWRASL